MRMMKTMRRATIGFELVYFKLNGYYDYINNELVTCNYARTFEFSTFHTFLNTVRTRWFFRFSTPLTASTHPHLQTACSCQNSRCEDCFKRNKIYNR